MENRTSWSKRTASAFVLSLMILAIIGWFSYQSISSLIEVNHRITDTQKAPADLESLQQLSVQAEARAYRVMWVFGSSSLLTLLLLASAAWIIKRELTARERATAEVRRLNEELERRVSERTAQLIVSNQQLKDEIVERRRVEHTLRESQLKLSGVISSAMDAIISVDKDQRVTLFNNAAERMFGCSASEAIGQTLDRFIPERFRGVHREHICAFGQSHVTRRRMGALGAVYGLRSDGEEISIEASISHLEADGQKVYTVILRDITERQKAEERLREQAALLDQARDAIVVRDLQGRIRYWNKSAERLYRWTAEEAIGRDVRQLVYPGLAEQFEQTEQSMLERGEWSGELRQFTKDGRELIAESRWTLVRDADENPKAIFTINTDLTEKKKLEAQFLRAQRMESIGTLAGGIAHDLNNILSPILIGLQLLQAKLTDQDSQRWLNMLIANAERGGEMVRQVLSFARGVSGERINLQPKHLIREVVKMLQETLPKNIGIESKLPNDLGIITGDPTQLHQVLMNLCINARDAMPDGGRLKITAENTTIDRTYVEMQLAARPGDYLCIIVSDTGHGIPPKIINQIFDPFFTTKPQGQGTGLGLSTVQGIVKGHGGFINVYSEVGQGSQFSVYLPLAETRNAESLAARQTEIPFGGGELVMVVDDETAIREIAKGTLENFGYRVLTASDGAEALALYAEHKGEIAVVLTDMMMPLMDGPATIRALKKINPKIRIIASSGLDVNDKMAEATGAGIKSFLPKPYTAGKLLKTLAEVLRTE
jgi:two-component system, cell cycle sensor histidine kinase and response regulator CckA